MAEITDQVIEFYNELFERIFFKPFVEKLAERRRRDAVRFQILEAAGAASQSLERFIVSQRLTASQVICVLSGLQAMSSHLSIEHIANPNVLPEEVVNDLLNLPACSPVVIAVTTAQQQAVFRVALHSVVQALMQIGPVMAEWQNIGFPSTFELSRRVVAPERDQCPVGRTRQGRVRSRRRTLRATVSRLLVPALLPR